MKIVLAADHGGVPLKQAIAQFLATQQISIEDLGAYSNESVDYPSFASKVAQRVSSGQADAGILVCGTGLGMAITANKFKGVRAVAISDLYSARMAKEHNNANVLALGGRVLDPEKALRLVEVWLKTPFQGGRHQKRLDQISQIENQNFR